MGSIGILDLAMAQMRPLSQPLPGDVFRGSVFTGKGESLEIQAYQVQKTLVSSFVIPLRESAPMNPHRRGGRGGVNRHPGFWTDPKIKARPLITMRAGFRL